MTTEPTLRPGQRVIVPAGDGKFHVIEITRPVATGLSLDETETISEIEGDEDVRTH